MYLRCVPKKKKFLAHLVNRMFTTCSCLTTLMSLKHYSSSCFGKLRIICWGYSTFYIRDLHSALSRNQLSNRLSPLAPPSNSTSPLLRQLPTLVCSSFDLHCGEISSYGDPSKEVATQLIEIVLSVCLSGKLFYHYWFSDSLITQTSSLSLKSML